MCRALYFAKTVLWFCSVVQDAESFMRLAQASSWKLWLCIALYFLQVAFFWVQWGRLNSVCVAQIKSSLLPSLYTHPPVSNIRLLWWLRPASSWSATRFSWRRSTPFISKSYRSSVLLPSIFCPLHLLNGMQGKVTSTYTETNYCTDGCR
jgi:hypothetical protein